MGEINPDTIERHFIIEDAAKKLHLKKEHKKLYITLAIICTGLAIIAEIITICLMH